MHFDRKYMFKIEEVKKTYNEKTVLNVPELKILRGKLTGIAGYSGSGKTTLINILGLLDKPDIERKTKLEIDGYVTTFNKNEFEFRDCYLKFNEFRKAHFGYIFQDNFLPKNLRNNQIVEIPKIFTKYNNSMIPLTGKNGKHKYNIDNYAKLLNSLTTKKYPVDWKKQLKKKAFELSGGEAQKISVAAAINKSPSILIADEPTSNLDYPNGDRMMAFLKKWTVKENRTAIVVSHHMHQVCKYCDQIILMKDGKIVESVSNEITKYSVDSIIEKLK